MKKKAIEKIPYLTLPKVSRKKAVKFIAVTAFKNVAHERHLFLEVYENDREKKDIPVIRIVLTKKDFGNFFPESGEWTRQKIETDHYYNSNVLLWHKERPYTWQQGVKENILFSDNDLDRIKKICTEKVWGEELWWESIYRHEDAIITTARRAAETRKYERRQQALKERAENTPPLPEEKVLERADQILHHKHFLYYKKRGSRAEIACSKCGGVTEGRWKSGMSYESQFEKRIEEPVEKHHGVCPMCGALGEYKCQGKAQMEYSKSIHLFLGQKYKETGMVIRYIEVSKTWVLEEIGGEKGLEMHGAYEKLDGIEIARGYFIPEKKVQIDFHKHNPYSREDFWDDCNLWGMKNIRIDPAPVMWQTWEEMKGTLLQYSAAEEYTKEENVNLIEYMKRYQEIPQLEMLVKLGLTGVAKEIVEYRCGIIADSRAERPDQFLGIRKERVKQLIDRNGDKELLQAMKLEKRMGAVWTDEQLEHIAEAGLSRGQIEGATAYMSLQQLLNRIRKYAGCDWGTKCVRALQRLRNTATTYIDYLNMRLALGYDLHNSVYQQPRDLTAAHTKMVTESSKKEADKRLAEVKTRFSDIRKQYRKLRNRYFWEDENLLIRPARSAEEIVMEGRILHHCVGGDGYLGKHNRGETYILMLRQQEDPEIPYITVEIHAESSRIIQWYGAHDKKPDEKAVQKWLDSYTTRLKCGAMAAGMKEAADTGGQQVLQNAV